MDTKTFRKGGKAAGQIRVRLGSYPNNEVVVVPVPIGILDGKLGLTHAPAAVDEARPLPRNLLVIGRATQTLVQHREHVFPATEARVPLEGYEIELFKVMHSEVGRGQHVPDLSLAVDELPGMNDQLLVDSKLPPSREIPEALVDVRSVHLETAFEREPEDFEESVCRRCSFGQCIVPRLYLEVWVLQIGDR